jgi:PAS domain S-box-containing protein
MSDREELERRLRYERGLSACSQALVLGGHEALQAALRALREAVDVCRVYLFENIVDPAAGLCMRQTHEDCREGVSVEIDNPLLQHLPYAGAFSEWADALAANRPVTGHTEDFPPAARDIFEAEQIKSILALPVWVSQAWWGFVGFDDTRSARVWSQHDIGLLRTAADLIGSYLERTAAQEAVRTEKAFSERLLESLPGIFYVYDQHLRLRRWNRNHETTTGYSAEELQQRGALDWFTDPAERARVADTGRQLFETGQTDVVAHLTTKDGRRVPHLFRSVRLDTAEGPMAMGVAFDISDRVRAEAELRLSEQRFKRIVESSPMGMHLYELQDDDRLVFAGANPAAETILGVRQEAFVGRTIEDAFPPLAGTEIPDRYREVVRTGNVWRTTHVEYNDQVIRGAFDVVAFRIAPGHMVVMFLDVSERERAALERQELERRLQHAQKLESLGVLAGGLAHDFNNLLMAVLGNLDLAQQGLSPASPARAGIEQALSATRKATELTRQMLAYSGKGKFVVTSLDLNAIVRENADLLRAAVSRTVTLSLDLAAGPVCFEGDPGQIQQVVMNLITNASDAIGERAGVVMLRTGVVEADDELLASSRVDQRPAPGPFASLEVADTGCGMDDDTQQRLFDPFFTTKFTGRGLGMSAVLGIVRGHRGGILVDSTPGRGTVVRVLFPFLPGAAITSSPHPAQGPAPVGAAPARALVLVVDDDASVRRLCVTFVERLGHEALEAADGEAALVLFRQRPEIACVLLDLTMPRLGGLETFREMRRLRPGVRVILASGYSEVDAVQRFVGEGLAGFVQKPFRMADLKARLDLALS